MAQYALSTRMGCRHSIQTHCGWVPTCAPRRFCKPATSQALFQSLPSSFIILPEATLPAGPHDRPHLPTMLARGAAAATSKCRPGAGAALPCTLQLESRLHFHASTLLAKEPGASGEGLQFTFSQSATLFLAVKAPPQAVGIQGNGFIVN
ncbi:hypothetical protein BDZ91DRAFT_62646 [Kalaharituber pfeilii]|nr:hypothetical protein BDZ91DRAFT_62646 [Kalaharituber pfeilii]